jgi:nucleotide-binding universal stress UspA family protein
VKNILVAIDDCESTSITSPIMERAMEMANAFSSKVWLLHVIPDTDRPHPYNIDGKVLRSEVASELRCEHDFLHRLAQCLRERGIDASAHLAEGATIKMILESAERLEADLIILGCHRHSLLLGVLTEFAEEGLLGKCPRPIMFVPLPE